MALDVTNSSTWQASTLDTPDGPVTYWAIADWDAYYEQYEDDNNLTRIHIAVAWGDATTFKKYALGFAEFVPGMQYFQRYPPLRNPYLAEESQYLTSLRKVKIHAGVKPAASGGASLHFADPLLDNWPNFYGSADGMPPGMPPRIIYEAVFSNFAYDVMTEQEFIAAGKLEIRRHVVRTKSVNARERKVPAQAFQATIGGATTTIPEVGFIPFYDYRLRYLWTRVPRDRVPDTAIANCLLKANDAVFDWNPVTETYGKYREGDLVFTGLFQDIKPYRGTNGEWLVDVPYEFRYQPADGTGDGMLKVPYWSATAGNTWIKPFVRGSAGSEKYLYSKASFETLFIPEP